MEARMNFDKFLSQMKSKREYLTGYFSNGNGQISEDIVSDDFDIEREKITELCHCFERLSFWFSTGLISRDKIIDEVSATYKLLELFMNAESNEKRKPDDFLNVQNCNDLATINTTNIRNEK